MLSRCFADIVIEIMRADLLNVQLVLFAFSKSHAQANTINSRYNTLAHAVFVV